jgi:hypothetical protein
MSALRIKVYRAFRVENIKIYTMLCTIKQLGYIILKMKVKNSINFVFYAGGSRQCVRTNLSVRVVSRYGVSSCVSDTLRIYSL